MPVFLIGKGDAESEDKDENLESLQISTDSSGSQINSDRLRVHVSEASGTISLS